MYLHHLLEKIKDDDNDEMIACLIITAISNSLENFFGKLQEIEYLKIKSQQLSDLHSSLAVRFFDTLLSNFPSLVKATT